MGAWAWTGAAAASLEPSTAAGVLPPASDPAKRAAAGITGAAGRGRRHFGEGSDRRAAATLRLDDEPRRASPRAAGAGGDLLRRILVLDRKSTRLNSSH